MNDVIPEINETFVVALVSAIPVDNTGSSSSHSSATISRSSASSCNITILTNDDINGLFQIMSMRPPNSTFIQSRYSIGRHKVGEESGTVRLYVVRTQGTKGIINAAS